MEDKILKQRIDACTEFGMAFNGESFVGKFDYNSDFNVHYTELMCEDAKWEEIITTMRQELTRRKPIAVVEVPEEPKKKTKKVMVVSNGDELGMIGMKEKFKDKIGEDVEFIDMAHIPEGTLLEGLNNVDLLEMGKPYMDTLLSMPEMELRLMQRGMDDFRYGHLTKKEREADIQPVRTEPKIQRNDPCPCGSGKKYKNCCINKAK